MKEASKIKVLEICGGLSTEGIGMFLLNTFENIDQGKFEIHFALATKYQQVFENRIISKGGKIHRTYEIGEGLKGKLKHCINLYKLIKKEKYEVVHSHMDFFNGLNLLVAFLAKAPLRISHAHLGNYHNSSFTSKLYYWMMKNLIKIFSNKKIGCSKESNSLINSGGIELLNSINVEKFKKKYEIPEDVKIDNAKSNIIIVGRIDPPKNPYFIVDIAHQLKLKNFNFKIYWIGDGSLKNEILTKVNDLQLVSFFNFLGMRTDVEKLLSNMDLFLMPSKYEGLPFSLVEAQVSGLTCFISENISSEADIGLCKVINLDEGADYWADTIIHFFAKPNKFHIDQKKLNKFDIKETIKILEKEYQK